MIDTKRRRKMPEGLLEQDAGYDDAVQADRAARMIRARQLGLEAGAKAAPDANEQIGSIMADRRAARVPPPGPPDSNDRIGEILAPRRALRAGLAPPVPDAFSREVAPQVMGEVRAADREGVSPLASASARKAAFFDEGERANMVRARQLLGREGEAAQRELRALIGQYGSANPIDEAGLAKRQAIEARLRDLSDQASSLDNLLEVRGSDYTPDEMGRLREGLGQQYERGVEGFRANAMADAGAARGEVAGYEEAAGRRIAEQRRGAGMIVTPERAREIFGREDAAMQEQMLGPNVIRARNATGRADRMESLANEPRASREEFVAGLAPVQSRVEGGRVRYGDEEVARARLAMAGANERAATRPTEAKVEETPEQLEARIRRMTLENEAANLENQRAALGIQQGGELSGIQTDARLGGTPESRGAAFQNLSTIKSRLDDSLIQGAADEETLAAFESQVQEIVNGGLTKAGAAQLIDGLGGFRTDGLSAGIWNTITDNNRGLRAARQRYRDVWDRLFAYAGYGSPWAE